MTTAEMQAEALSRAQHGQSLTNYPTIYEGFAAKGIDPADVKPRENVFTFNAWKALGRHVRKGEHGVRVFTRIPIEAKKDKQTGETIRPAGSAARTTTVFHISQTDPCTPAKPYSFEGGEA